MTEQAHPGTPPLADCESEQLHLSGRIQAHGALIAADLQDRRITYASANTAELIGAQPDQLFDSSVTSIFAPDEQPRLDQAIQQIDNRRLPVDLYGIGLTAGGGVDITVRQAGGQIVIEIEHEHDGDQAQLIEVLDVSQQIGEAKSVADVEAAVARAVGALTGYDRAMVYRFHDDEHGEVVAEDCRPGLVRYLGHHFPVSDIPLQARQIYTRVGSRYIPDVDEGDVAILGSPRTAGAGLDLNQVALRSVSPFHLEYMRNMGTAASLSFAMVDGDRLTRLVSCTNVGPRSVSSARRRACELVVLLAKLQVSTAEKISSLGEEISRESIRARLRAAMQCAPTVVEGLTADSGALLELCHSDGAAACVDGQYRSVGAAPSEEAVRRLAGEIRATRNPSEVWATDRLPQSVADSLGVAGCLFVALGASEDFLIWFRRDRPHQLRWLGDPNAHSTGVINPRKSFDTWLEDISGSSVPWTTAEMQAAQLVAFEIEEGQLSHAQAKLAYLGLHDALTGLPNRRYLSEAMAAMLADVTPTNPLACIFIDLNRFKEVNDLYGHDAGDAVLREAARRIVQATRAQGDVVGRADVWDPPAGRLGGDEFVVVLPGTDGKGAALVADRIRQSLLKPVVISPELQVNIGAAIGLEFATEPEEPKDLLRRADAAMYEDKRTNRAPLNPND